ncbi:SpvB/TcaC N-terminal domain-containing protein, partial [Bradyrhizobium sp. CCBAU 65884]|uniref:SpvB/TcaC N-terminal domain-containing protein n=1 Tax=Bradyrhizobium sp. CCBAU 65884 TaxID=722477 RepID=UPI00230635A9
MSLIIHTTAACNRLRRPSACYCAGVGIFFFVKTFRWNSGSVQWKAISLFAFVSIALAPVQPAFAAFGGGTPTIPNSNLLTGDVADPRIDGSTGAFTQKISLDIPPGRNGLQPDVSLQYNSQNTSDGIVGYGWSLSIPYIQYLNKTGSQNFYSSNSNFISSIDGELAYDNGSSTPASPVPA